MKVFLENSDTSGTFASFWKIGNPSRKPVINHRMIYICNVHIGIK